MSKLAASTYRDASIEEKRKQLVTDNLPFVKHVLGRLVGRLPHHVDLENLESAGVLGLVEASHQYDAEVGVGFRTFAYRRVWGAIIDELRRNSPLSQKMMTRIALVRRVQEQLEPPVTAERIAEHCDLDADQVETCLDAIRLASPSPLTSEMLTFIHDPESDSTSSAIEFEEAKKSVADCIANLPEQQRLVITLYHGEDLRLKEIGRVLNLSESRISRVLAKAEQAVRDALETEFS